jgi:hypothetical protein
MPKDANTFINPIMVVYNETLKMKQEIGEMEEG